MRIFVALVLVVVNTIAVAAQESQPGTEPGQVQLPLATYNQLVESSQQPLAVPRPVPAAFAIGAARVTVNVASSDPRPSAEVAVELAIDVLEDEWCSIPVLPAGTPVTSATVNGQAVQLISSSFGLVWGVKNRGSFTMNLAYRVDADRSGAGFSLPVPLPQAAATSFSATLPGTGLDIAVIPAAGVRTQTRGSATQVTATIPTTSGVQLTWRTPTALGHAVGRAIYSGQLAGQAVTFSGEFSVELFSDETATLALLPRSVTLRDIRVDDREAPILIVGDRYATLVRGRGQHVVVVGFQVPVISGDGPPRVDLVIPEVPVSRFDLTLPGRKEVSVTPRANVVSRSRGNSTTATAFVAMGSRVSFTWAEAVPEAIRTEIRANAAIYHAVYGEEGVLFVRAIAVFEVTRGETSQVTLLVPPGVQVNRIVSPEGAVADWRLVDGRDGARSAEVFLDRKISGELRLDVFYDRSLGDADALEIPMLRAGNAHRQRGMVALLASKELTLQPSAEGGATRVGENQLPAFVRNELEMTVAHTFKYVDLPQGLTVSAQLPERQQGRFDAQVATLISLDEVAMKGQASVEIDVKSGGIENLELTLPENLNLLSLTGPSLRSHTIAAGQDDQRIAVAFTQEMEGQFRLEVAYERILVDAEAEVEVPTVGVAGAEVEQGKLAIEAKSAVEVQATIMEQLSDLDITELPQQLVLRTTNPILLAYKYVHADPPHRLVLRVTRHSEVPVQEAAIDTAFYTTLFTPDGLAVTTADFAVRNSRKQFLRLQLPPESVVWSAFVDGQPEKPAFAEEQDEDSITVLIKIVTSTRGFPVQLIYATSGSRIGWLGTVAATLPRPDILVTKTRWNVLLPEGKRYGEPSTNMDIVDSGEPVPISDQDQAAGLESAAAQAAMEPLRIQVPASGIRFTFEKLYANHGGEDAHCTIPYATAAGGVLGVLGAVFGTLILCFGAFFLLRPDPRVDRRIALWSLLGAVALLVLIIGVGRVSLTPVVVTALLVGLAFLAFLAWRTLLSRQAPPPVPDEAEAEPGPVGPSESSAEEEAEPDQGETDAKEDELS